MEETQQLMALIAAGGLLIGLLIGGLMGRGMTAEGRGRRELQSQVSDLQRKQADYQEEVNQHFNETAELLNQMANSYREVHNHLVHGAQQLTASGISPLQALPEGRPILESKTIPATQTLEQPKDYAPKDPGGKGELHPEFGIDRHGNKVSAETVMAPPTDFKQAVS